MRGVGLWLWLGVAGTCVAGPIEDYCHKPDIPNPKLCEQTMKGQVGKDWPDTASPNRKSHVKTSKTKAPPLAVPSVQKWFKRLPPWPQTVEAAQACRTSPFGKELEARIQDESQLATQRALLGGTPTASSKPAKDAADFARLESDPELQQCLDPKAVKFQLEDAWNLPHETESLTVPLRAAHDQEVENCRVTDPQTCDGQGQCGTDPDCELKADNHYEAALAGAVNQWLADAAPKYAADRDRVQACLNKLSSYHKAAVAAHNAGATPSPAALGTTTDLNLIKGLSERQQAYCKAATEILDRPPG